MTRSTPLLLVTTGAAVLWSFPSFAQAPAGAQAQAQDFAIQSTPEPATCLVFADALEAVARLAPTVRTAEARLDESEADLVLARSLFRPQVSTFVRTGIGDSGLSDSQIENQVGLRVSQRLFDFGDARHARDAARASIDARRFEVEAARDAAVETVARDYLGWLEVTERLAATREREAYFTRQTLATEALIADGGATITDRADIEAERLEAESARTELEFMQQRFAARLTVNTRLAGSPCSREAARDVLSIAVEPVISGAIGLSEAVAYHPELAALRRSTDSLSAQAVREAGARLPVISLTGTTSYADDDVSGSRGVRSRLGIDVSLPLYTGSALSGRADGARARARQAEGRLSEAVRQLEESLSIAGLRVRALRSQTRQRDQAAAARAEQLDAAERQFAAGLRTLPDLIEVRLQFEAAELARIDTRYALLNEELNLARLSGRIRILTEPQS